MVQDWLSLLLRWAHIVAGIGWIGSSFYFMWLDASLKRRADTPPGAKGDSWSVHGGGFYHVRKYAVAPDAMPDDLHWFKWESYLTWLTGFALLAVIYYWGAESFLVKRDSGLSVAQTVLVSMASLGAGWAVYDRLCRSPLKADPTKVFAVLFAFILAMGWFYYQVFTPRAAFLHIGALIATIMSGNVFFVIIPNQRIVVADLIAGRTPAAEYGAIAKLRSTHNNYLTLPVVFMMISNHYPMTFGHPQPLVIVAGVLALGVIVRNWFNRHEAGERGRGVAWQWPAAGAVAVALMAFTSWRPDAGAAVAAAPVTTAEALAIAQTHCAACHAERPSHDGFDAAPGGVMLHTAELLKRHAPQVMAQAVLSRAMPLGDETGMTDAERAALGAWIAAGMPDG